MKKKFLVFIILLFSQIFFIIPITRTQEKNFEKSKFDYRTITECKFNWSIFWLRFKSFTKWNFEYLENDIWVSRKDLLKVVRDFPQENRCKICLNFTTDKAGDYRLTFAINREVKEYVNKSSNFEYNLTYSDFSVIFNWSDLKEIPSLKINHEIKDNFFWFRIRKNNIPANRNVILDPYTIITSTAQEATAYESGSKVFRNPRGLKYYYSMVYNGSYDYINFYKSEDGSIWSLDTELFDIDLFEGAGLWIYDTGSKLWVCFVWINDYDINDESVLYFRKGYIEDSTSHITLQETQSIHSSLEGWLKDVSICMDSNNRIWIVYSMKRSPNMWDLVCKISINPLDEDLPTWTAYQIIHTAITSGLQNWADIAPFSSSPTPNVLVVFVYRDFQLDIHMGGRECQYEQKKFTLHTFDEFKPVGLQDTDHPSLVIDSNDKGHVISGTLGTPKKQYHIEWIVGQGNGFGDLDTIINKNCLSRTITIDENDTLYAFYTSSLVTEDYLFYKNSTDYGETWNNEINVSDGLGLRLKYLSVVYSRMWSNDIQIIWTTEAEGYYHYVRFWEIGMIPEPEIDIEELQNIMILTFVSCFSIGFLIFIIWRNENE